MNSNWALRNRLVGGLFALCAMVATGAQATVITFVATDIADTTPGQDLWSYTYSVSGVSFLSGEGFTLYFDPALYASLDLVPAAVNADWDVLTTQPDAINLPTFGLYDAMALLDAPSLADPFTVSFVWLGAGAPGSQAYDQYDAGFNAVASGTTVPGTPVPEPATPLLALAALGALAACRKRGGAKV
jgi:hypothetical protein